MKNYRLFGFINPVDVILIVALVALVWVAYLFSMPREINASGGQQIRFTLELGDRPAGFFQQIEAGSAVFDGVGGAYIGRVVYAYGLPFLQDVPDEANNIIRRTPVAGREFTYIVVEAWANITDYATEIGNFEARVNLNMYARSRNFAGGGFIVRLEVV